MPSDGTLKFSEHFDVTTLQRFENYQGSYLNFHTNWDFDSIRRSMSTCRWCTPGGLSTIEFLKEYASKRLSTEDSLSANDDLSYCLECVVEYHKARDDLPTMHKALWEMETSRLVTQFEKSMKAESIEEDELFFVEEDGEIKLPEFVGPDFENNLRVPLLEILKYPYLLLHERISELCVEALCKMERVSYSFQVFDKHPGIYLLLVHPNEMIRRWAILTARSLGKVDRDDYYDLQEVFTCLFKVIELGLFDSPDIYSLSPIDRGKLLLLPSHLYDTKNYKNYWLGICMLLTVLEEQAMDSLLLGPDKQNDFMQSILHTMERDTYGDRDDPFWPALHCFMVILDRLGAKVWGQLIDPIQAFQTIIDSTSYKNEIESIRNSTRRTKIEPGTEYGEDLVTCSQIVYDFNTEKPKKDSGWRNAICPDYYPNMYEEMQTLANVLQSDIGQDMRVHNSTFLWFIPFVQSVMDLKDLGVAYIVEVIHHLYSEIKDVLSKRVEQCDKVTEFFILILVSVIELHRNKKCLHLLWVSSQKWVEALVKCAKLPAKDFRRYSEKMPGTCPRISSTSSSTALSVHSQATNSVQYSCVQLIRSLLREGSQLGQQASCKHFLDKLNHLLRGNIFLGLQLSEKETQDLQLCLKQVIRSSKDRTSVNTTSHAEQNALGSVSHLTLSRIKREDTDEWCRMKEYCQSNSPSPPPPSDSRSYEGCCLSSPSRSRNNSCEEEAPCKEPPLYGAAECSSPEREPAVSRPFEMHTLSNRLQETVSKSAQNPERNFSSHAGFDTDHQEFFTRESVWQGRYELATGTVDVSAAVSSTPYQGECDSSKEKRAKPPSSSESDMIPPKFKNMKVNLVDLHSKLAKAMEKSSAFKLQKANQNPETKSKKQSELPSPCPTTVHTGDQGGNLKKVLDPKNSGNEGKSTAKTFAPPAFHIKQEPEERSLDLHVTVQKSNASDKVSGSDRVGSLPLAQLKNTSIKDLSSFDSNSATESAVSKKLGLSPSATSESRPGRCTDKPMGISPVKLSDRQFEFGDCTKTRDCKKNSESDSDDGIPLTQVRRNLVTRRKSLATKLDAWEDSNVDGDLNRQSKASCPKAVDFTLDSSPDQSLLPAQDHIRRKVKGTFRSSVPEKSPKFLGLNDQVIVISDSTSEEEPSSEEETILDMQKPIKQEKQQHEGYCDVQPSSASMSLHVPKEIKREVTEAENLPEQCEEYNSQFFEFETEDEVYSVWQDSQVEQKPSVDDGQVSDPASTAAQGEAGELDLADKYIEWGYDTDYISDELIEEAVEAAEEQLAEKEHAEMKSSEDKTEAGCKDPTSRGHSAQPDQNASQFKRAKPADSAVKNTTNNFIAKTKSSLASKRSLEKCKNASANSDTRKLATPVRARTETLTKISDKGGFGAARPKKKHVAEISPRKHILPRTTPAVVPPKKDRRCPEPTSAAEKLGFKKPPRKAFDLSQRSLDSLAQLRNHGKVAGTWEVKAKQRSRLIAPKALPVKGNRKLLACQDRQFYQQTRPRVAREAKVLDQASQSSNMVAQPKANANEPRLQPAAEDTVTGNRCRVQKTASVNASLSSKEKPLRRNTPVNEDIPTTDLSKTARNVNVVTPLARGPVDSDSRIAAQTVVDVPCFPSTVTSGSTCTDRFADGGGGDPASPSSHNNQDPSWFETNAPSNEDEEMEVDDHLFLTQPDPVDMEICSQSENVGSIEICMNNEQVDMQVEASAVLPPDTAPSEHYKCKHTECVEVVKMPGFFCLKHVIVETSGDHVFAMPGLPPSFLKPAKPPTAKIYSSGSASRSANLFKELENIPKPTAPLKNKSQVAMPPIPRKNASEAIKNTSSRPSSPCTVLQDLMNQSNITHGWQTGRASAASAGSESGQPLRTTPSASYSPPKQRDQTFLIQEILRWSHAMFTSFNQFGAPINLSQFPSSNVPLSFSGYEEYFLIFFPLLMLNTFESMVQEWLENQKHKSKNTYQLQLQNFCTDRQMNRVDFQVWVRDAHLAKQLHPKEDDLVFLLESNDGQSEEGEMVSQPFYRIGHVARFSRSQMNETRSGEKYTACHLVIQTKGTFSGARNQQVTCEVIGGLVSTQRQFKALLQLRWSPLVKPIIQPNPPEFFPSNKVNLVTEGNQFPYLKDYNENQKKAIDTAYAMVKQHPGLPRICLIHGPPGTGKSKTIVGLLQRVLTEKPTDEVRTQNLNAKNKRNRVLVCAPSNAGIDELMKKIIVEFKEKCQNKNSFLGNCGDINLVRLGSEKAISSDVQRFSLDSQVSRKMNRNAFGLNQDIERKKEALDRRLDELSRQRAMERCDNKERRNEDLDQEIGRVAAERQQLASQLKEVRKHLPEVQGSIILESHIICCTLNTSGSFLLEAAFRRLGHDPFSCVIVDEAGQACEVETLIPLTHRCSKLILVGDPEQLPATVISTKAQEYGYGQSMMARLRTRLESVTSKTPVLQLTVQYRMHPDICLFPSNYIYGKTLRTDRMTEEMRCSADWPFQPYLLFDVSDGTERRVNESSYANFQEVKLVIELMKLIKDKKKELGFRHIGIITPYRAQKNMIMQELDKEFGAPNRPGEVDTVDGFQGRQKDCIIVTCVRANACQGSIGFLASRQRLNVTITRAKYSLFILGSLKTLMENKDWNELIQDAQKRGAIIKTREDNYKKDVTKILKLKPAFQRSLSHPSVAAGARPQHAPGRTERKELTNGLDVTRLPLPPPLPKPHAALPPPQPAQRPMDSRRVAAVALKKSAGVAPLQAVAPPASQERPRDPRLARKMESAGAVGQTTPSHSGHALPQASGHYQASTLLPHRTAVGANVPSQAPHQSSATTAAYSNGRSRDYRASWQDKNDQGDWRGYTENKQWGTRRNYSPGNKKAGQSSQEAKRQKTSN